jgi:hypothetical protein
MLMMWICLYLIQDDDKKALRRKGIKKERIYTSNRNFWENGQESIYTHQIQKKKKKKSTSTNIDQTRINVLTHTKETDSHIYLFKKEGKIRSSWL